MWNVSSVVKPRLGPGLLIVTSTVSLPCSMFQRREDRSSGGVLILTTCGAECVLPLDHFWRRTGLPPVRPMTSSIFSAYDRDLDRKLDHFPKSDSKVVSTKVFGYSFVVKKRMPNWKFQINKVKWKLNMRISAVVWFSLGIKWGDMSCYHRLVRIGKNNNNNK